MSAPPSSIVGEQEARLIGSSLAERPIETWRVFKPAPEQVGGVSEDSPW